MAILILKACGFSHPYSASRKGTWTKQTVTTFKFLCESELLHNLEHLLTLICREIRTEGGRNRDNRGYECSRCSDLFDRCGFGPFRHPPAGVDGDENFIAFSRCIEGRVQHNDFCCKARQN